MFGSGRRLLTSTLAIAVSSVLAISMAPAANAAELPANWEKRRVLKQEQSKNRHDRTGTWLVTDRNAWALVARGDYHCNTCGGFELRLRERRPGRAWAKPRNLPARVRHFDHDVDASGGAWMTYVHDGQVWASRHQPRGRTAKQPERVAAYDESAGANPEIVAGGAGRALVAVDNTLFTRDSAGAWTSAPSPLPATARKGPGIGTSVSYGGYGPTVAYEDPEASDVLLLFYTDTTTNSTMGMRRGADGVWSAPQPVHSRGTVDLELVQTRLGTRLVGADDRALVWEYRPPTAGGVFSVGAPRELTESWDEDSTRVDAQVDASGTLTVIVNRYLSAMFVWQEDRPQGRYLETPLRHSFGNSFGSGFGTVSPGGTITLLQPNDRAGSGSTRSFVVKHLPAGKNRWTKRQVIDVDGSRHAGLNAIGGERSNGDLVLMATDRRGMLGYDIDQPRARTKIVAPTKRKVERTYKLRWRTTWADATTWQLRHRRPGRGGPWRKLSIADGARERTVSPATARCYQARGRTLVTGWTPWSTTHCFRRQG